MKKTFILLPLLVTLAILTGCSSKEENRESVRVPNINTLAQTQQISLAVKPVENLSYWYECDYYGICWDSEDYTWYDCYYNAFSKNCAKGNYWKGSKAPTGEETDESEESFEECDSYGNCVDTEGYKWYDPEKDTRNVTNPDDLPPTPNITTKGNSCCDSWGNCYDENSQQYKDPTYLKVDYCDECGNCYDYYGNYVSNDQTYVDPYWCEQYYQYEKVNEWDVCGNAYDDYGNFLFYDNYYYDFQACNNDYTTYCGEGFGGPDSDTTDETEENIKPQANIGSSADYCDECGNCYDYYGNSLGYDEAYYDEYWCSQYYQYDNVKEWDTCGNAYDEYGNFLFYDNKHYDYKACYNDYSSTSPSSAKLDKNQRKYTS